MKYPAALALLVIIAAACGDDSTPSDTGTSADTGRDAGAADSAPSDTGAADGSAADTSTSADAAMDTGGGGIDAGPSAITVSAAGGTIPDGPGGCFGGGNCLCRGDSLEIDLEVSDSFPVGRIIVALDNIDFGAVGELNLGLMHVDTGTESNLLEGPPNTGPTTSISCGDASPMEGDYVLDEASELSLRDAARESPRPVPEGTYFPVNRGGGAIEVSAAFAGEDAAGTWRVRLSDLGGPGNTVGGTLGGVRLVLAPAAAP